MALIDKPELADLRERLESIGAIQKKLVIQKQVGMAYTLCFLRDIFTSTTQGRYTKAEILHLLALMANDAEFFPDRIGIILWGSDD